MTKRLLRHQSETQNTIPNTSTEKNAQISKKNNTLAESVAFRKEQKNAAKACCRRVRSAVPEISWCDAHTALAHRGDRLRNQTAPLHATKNNLAIITTSCDSACVHCHSTDPKLDSHHRHISLSGNQARIEDLPSPSQNSRRLSEWSPVRRAALTLSKSSPKHPEGKKRGRDERHGRQNCT